MVAWPTVVRNHVSNPASLLRRQKELFKQYLALEREIADLDRQIIASGTPRRRVSRPSAASGGVSEDVREMLRIMQLVGGPVARGELAARMDVRPKTASRYLARALKLRVVERVGYRLYRVVNTVPPLEARDAR